MCTQAEAQNNYIFDYNPLLATVDNEYDYDYVDTKNHNIKSWPTPEEAMSACLKGIWILWQCSI